MHTNYEQILTRLQHIEAMLECRVQPTYLTIREASEYLRCSPSSIRRMLNKADLPFCRVGESDRCTILILYSDIQSIINGGK